MNKEEGEPLAAPGPQGSTQPAGAALFMDSGARVTPLLGPLLAACPVGWPRWPRWPRSAGAVQGRRALRAVMAELRLDVSQFLFLLSLVRVDANVLAMTPNTTICP